MGFLFFFLCATQLMAANVVKEMSAEDVWLEAYLNDSGDLSELILSDKSRIRYEYRDRRLVKITRLNASEEEMYAHTYEWNGARLISQTGWFTTHYAYDDRDRIIVQSNPWYHETIECDSMDRLIRVGDRVYSYNTSGEIIGEEGFFRAVYDDQHNLIELNSSCTEVDERNQVVGLSYDTRGNLLKEGFTYNEKNQLIQAGGKSYTYDNYGRRIGKDTVTYLYLGWEEIASFEDGRCKTLKVPGIGGAVAIEIDGKPYAPVIDVQGIIRKLIDPETNSVYKEICSDVFGQGITEMIPYAYRGKRYDPETSLIYFGLRYYDPAQHRWLTPDPLGAIDHENLYQYVYNNPLLYWDATGASFLGYVGGLCQIVAGGALIIGGLGVELVTCGGFTVGLGVTTGSGMALIANGLATTTRHAQDIKMPNISWGNSEGYVPERPHSPMKTGSVDPALPANPDDLLKRPGWKETTHPDAGKKGHRTFENEETGEIIRHDRGKRNQTGHKAQDHYHHQVPNGKGGYTYVDGEGNPVPAGSNQAHLYPNTVETVE
jgi:RHS repeat-associated protein